MVRLGGERDKFKIKADKREYELAEKGDAAIEAGDNEALDKIIKQLNMGKDKTDPWHFSAISDPTDPDGVRKVMFKGNRQTSEGFIMQFDKSGKENKPGETGVLSSPNDVRQALQTGQINPATGKPWTRAEAKAKIEELKGK